MTRRFYSATSFMAVNAIHKMGVMLRSGVTTLRDNGARGSILFGVREALEHGLVEGLRLLLAGRPLTPTGGHFHFCGGVAGSEVEIRREVRQLIKEGADHIKIMASGGGTPSTNPGLPSYSAAELRSAVDSAHDYGRITTAHCLATKAIANAIETGFDCIEHAEFNEAVNLARHVYEGPTYERRWDPRLAEQLAESGMFVSLTLPGSGYTALAALERKRRDANLTVEEEATYDRHQRTMETRTENVRHFVDLGILQRLVISSDAGPFDIEFGKLYQGLAVAVEGGLTPMQALEACTRVAADACGVHDRVGTLKPGMQADIVVTSPDFLDDIRELQYVTAVFKAGAAVPM
jgi:imidazolonepropionase-like amidohydrolase